MFQQCCFFDVHGLSDLIIIFILEELAQNGVFPGRQMIAERKILRWYGESGIGSKNMVYHLIQMDSKRTEKKQIHVIKIRIFPGAEQCENSEKTAVFYKTVLNSIIDPILSVASQINEKSL